MACQSQGSDKKLCSRARRKESMTWLGPWVLVFFFSPLHFPCLTMAADCHASQHISIWLKTSRQNEALTINSAGKGRDEQRPASSDSARGKETAIAASHSSCHFHWFLNTQPQNSTHRSSHRSSHTHTHTRPHQSLQYLPGTRK